jgi:hypothetical protein
MSYHAVSSGGVTNTPTCLIAGARRLPVFGLRSGANAATKIKAGASARIAPEFSFGDFPRPRHFCFTHQAHGFGPAKRHQ